MDVRSSYPLPSSGAPLGYGGTIPSGTELAVNRMHNSFSVDGSNAIMRLTPLPRSAGVVFLYFKGGASFINSAVLVCPGGNNIQFAAGDSAIVQSLGDGAWRVLDYLPAATAKLLASNNLSDVTSKATSQNNLLPTPTRAGDLVYWNGSNWVTLAGNNSGTQIVTENSSGVPAFSNPATVGSSLVLIQSQAASASATIDFTSGLTSTYDQYLVTFTGVVPATNAQNFLLEISTDGGSTWKTGASDYKRVINTLSDAGTNTVSAAMTEAAMTLTIGQSNNSGRPVGGNMYIFGPSAGTLQPINWMMSYFDGSNNKMITGAGCYTAGAAINGLRFLFASGAITTGTFTLYGIRKA